MRPLPLKIFYFILFIGLSTPSNSQETTEFSENNNSIYLSYGNIIFSSQVSLTYDRSFYKKNNVGFSAKAIGGYYLYNWADYDDNAKVIDQYFGLATAFNFHIFEIYAGLASTGYRLAKNISDRSSRKIGFVMLRGGGLKFESKHILLRLGISNLELLHLSLGYRF